MKILAAKIKKDKNTEIFRFNSTCPSNNHYKYSFFTQTRRNMNAKTN